MEIVDNGSDNFISDKCFSSIKVRFNGSNNKLIIENCLPRNLGNIECTFEGDESVFKLDAVRRIGKLRVVMKAGGSISIGEKTSIEDAYFLAAGADINIGKDCMLSFQVNFRTTDAHGIYNLSSGVLINPPGDIEVQDHVWIGQGVLISSDVKIGSNSIIGAKAYLRNAVISQNVVAAGVPAKILREGVVWDRRLTSNIYDDDANIDPELRRWLI